MISMSARLATLYEAFLKKRISRRHAILTIKNGLDIIWIFVTGINTIMQIRIVFPLLLN
jgi:hypothetical protein